MPRPLSSPRHAQPRIRSRSPIADLHGPPPVLWASSRPGWGTEPPAPGQAASLPWRHPPRARWGLGRSAPPSELGGARGHLLPQDHPPALQVRRAGGVGSPPSVGEGLLLAQDHPSSIQPRRTSSPAPHGLSTCEPHSSGSRLRDRGHLQPKQDHPLHAMATSSAWGHLQKVQDHPRPAQAPSTRLRSSPQRPAEPPHRQRSGRQAQAGRGHLPEQDHPQPARRRQPDHQARPVRRG